jgi:hydrogenase maturation factor HypF (carbamoyltransferase family)
MAQAFWTGMPPDLEKRAMTEKTLCDHCKEELPDEPVRRGTQVYCCEACAFEASRSHDCGGRTDTPFSQRIIEMPEPPDKEVSGLQ